MSPGERRAAEPRVQRHSVRRHGLDLGGALAVPELPDVEVAPPAIDPRLVGEPAEQDVAGCLHEPLTLYDAPALVFVATSARERREYRWPGLLHLEEERVVRIAPEHQDDPTARPDAPHSHHLVGDVDEAIAVRQSADVRLK